MKNFKPKTINKFVASAIKLKKGGSWTIFLDLCKRCGICLEKCPNKGIYGTPTPEVKPEKCSLCGICELYCPDCAIKVNKSV